VEVVLAEEARGMGAAGTAAVAEETERGGAVMAEEAAVTVMAEAGRGLVAVKTALVVMEETEVASTRGSPHIRQTCTL